jgi:hypothetical protein
MAGGALAGAATGMVICVMWSAENIRPNHARLAGILALAGFAGSLLGSGIVATRYAGYAAEAAQFVRLAEIPTDMRAGLRSADLVARYPKDPIAHLLRAVYFVEAHRLTDAKPSFAPPSRGVRGRGRRGDPLARTGHPGGDADGPGPPGGGEDACRRNLRRAGVRSDAAAPGEGQIVRLTGRDRSPRLIEIAAARHSLACPSRRTGLRPRIKSEGRLRRDRRHGGFIPAPAPLTSWQLEAGQPG